MSWPLTGGMAQRIRNALMMFFASKFEQRFWLFKATRHDGQCGRTVMEDIMHVEQNKCPLGHCFGLLETPRQIPHIHSESLNQLALLSQRDSSTNNSLG